MANSQDARNGDYGVDSGHWSRRTDKQLPSERDPVTDWVIQLPGNCVEAPITYTYGLATTSKPTLV